MTKLIGIGGRLTAGKDVVADHLVEKHGWVKLGMSDPLLEMALILDPIVDDHDVRFSQVVEDYGYVGAKQNPEVRRFLQALGTDVGRNMIDQNIWVRQAEKAILERMEQGKNVVITGIRFDNELEMIDRWNRTRTYATSVWVDRPAQEQTKAIEHASEQLSSDGFDLVLTNDGTIEDLQKKVDDVLAA